MKRRRWFFVLAVAVSAMIWFARTHLNQDHESISDRSQLTTDSDPTESRGDSKNQTESGSANSPLSSSIPSPSLQTNPVLLDLATKTLLLACSRGSETFSGVGRESDFASLNEYFEKAPVLHGGIEATQDLLLQNLELSSPNRGKIRVRFSPQNETSKEPSKTPIKAEVFGVDSDGLPVLMPFPKELEGLSRIDQLAKLRSEFGTLNFDQKTVAFRWFNGESGTVSFRNGQIEEMQLYFKNQGSMGCAISGQDVKCRCLKSASR